MELRDQITLGSLFISDYRNTLGVDPREACDFFDGFVEFINELAADDGFDFSNGTFDELYGQYDTKENLEAWWYCFEECPLRSEADID